MAAPNSSRRQYRARAQRTEEQVQIQCRLYTSTRDRLFAEAERREVSVNYLVENSIEQSLTKWESQKLPD